MPCVVLSYFKHGICVSAKKWMMAYGDGFAVHAGAWCFVLIRLSGSGCLIFIFASWRHVISASPHIARPLSLLYYVPFFSSFSCRSVNRSSSALIPCCHSPFAGIPSLLPAPLDKLSFWNRGRPPCQPGIASQSTPSHAAGDWLHFFLFPFPPARAFMSMQFAILLSHHDLFMCV